MWIDAFKLLVACFVGWISVAMMVNGLRYDFKLYIVSALGGLLFSVSTIASFLLPTIISAERVEGIRVLGLWLLGLCYLMYRERAQKIGFDLWQLLLFGKPHVPPTPDEKRKDMSRT